jgi:hypothetical protein
MGAILHVHPPPVSALVPGVSPDLDRLITRCLAKDPKDRHAGSEALLIELRAVQLDGDSQKIHTTRSLIDRIKWQSR